MKVGVLALQGAFEPHLRVLAALGHEVRRVRRVDDLADADGLVLPGGESTTHLVLLERTGLDRPLDDFARSGRPVLCTCAGLILAARRVRRPEQRSFGWLGVEVERNGWGTQVDSFEARDDEGVLPLVFIRAPRIVAVDPDTTVLSTFRGEPVLVRRGAVWGATFHPELSGMATLHRGVFGPSVVDSPFCQSRVSFRPCGESHGSSRSPSTCGGAEPA